MQKPDKPSPPKTVRCRSCGAEYSAAEPNCPYCGTMNLPAAEKAYMNRLEDVRSGLEELGSQPAKKIRSNFLTLHKRVLLTAVVLLLVVFSVFVRNESRDRREEQQDRDDAVWQLEYYKKMDAAYDAGDYALLDELYSKAQDEGRKVWTYRHWRFCDFHLLITRAEQTLQEAKAGLADDAWLLYTGVYLLELENSKSWIPPDEYSLLETLRAPALNAVIEHFSLTEEEMEAFRRILRSESYISFNDCEAFLKERGNTP